MNQPHLTCVIPAWWPAMGPSQYLLGELTRYFRIASKQVEGKNDSQPAWELDIVTAVLPDHQSLGFCLDGCQTTRVGADYGFPWRRKSFSHSAVRAMARRTTSPTAILLFDMEDQVAEFRNGQDPSSRVIVRYDSAAEYGSLARAFVHRRIVRSLALADEIWTANQWQMDNLRLLGLPATHIRLVPDCVMPDDVDLPKREIPSTACPRRAARKSLCSVYDGLKNAMDDPLVVCAVPTSMTGAMNRMFAAWQQVVRHLPRAILWMVGDSSHSRDVMDTAQQLELDGNVCFPGSFDCLDEVMSAANLVVHPAATDEFAVTLLTGLRTGRAALAVRSDSPMERWLRDGENVFLLDQFEPSVAAERMLELLRDQELLDEVGQQARQDVGRHRNPILFAEALESFRFGDTAQNPFGAAL